MKKYKILVKRETVTYTEEHIEAENREKAELKANSLFNYVEYDNASARTISVAEIKEDE